MGKKALADKPFYESLEMACDMSDGAAVAELLGNRAGRRIDPERMWPALHVAATRGGAMACLAQLAPLATPSQASQALCLACSPDILIDIGDRRAMCGLLAPLCDPHALGDRRMTPLMAAARAGFVEIVEALIPRSELDRRCLPEFADGGQGECARHGATALRLASGGAGPGREGCLGALLAAGADARVPDTSGATPLMVARPNWAPATLRDLILASDPCAVDQEGNGAMAYFLELGRSDCVRMLIATVDEVQAARLLEQFDGVAARLPAGKGSGPLAIEARASLAARVEAEAIASVLDSADGKPARRRRI